jgi:hypothetical protein
MKHFVTLSIRDVRRIENKVLAIQRRKRMWAWPWEFLLGMFAGLSWMIPFAIGMKARERFDATGSIIGRVKMQKPIYRTDESAAELEEMLDAQER